MSAWSARRPVASDSRRRRGRAARPAQEALFRRARGKHEAGRRARSCGLAARCQQGPAARCDRARPRHGDDRHARRRQRGGRARRRGRPRRVGHDGQDRRAQRRVLVRGCALGTDGRRATAGAGAVATRATRRRRAVRVCPSVRNPVGVPLWVHHERRARRATGCGPLAVAAGRGLFIRATLCVSPTHCARRALSAPSALITAAGATSASRCSTPPSPSTGVPRRSARCTTSRLAASATGCPSRSSAVRDGADARRRLECGPLTGSRAAALRRRAAPHSPPRSTPARVCVQPSAS